MDFAAAGANYQIGTHAADVHRAPTCAAGDVAADVVEVHGAAPRFGIDAAT